MEIQHKVGMIAWKTLFGDLPMKVLDPNLPENHPRIIAEHEKDRQRLQNFVEGVGKPFFDHAREEIRQGIYALIVPPYDECPCKTCGAVRELGYLLKIVVKAESIIEDKQGEAK